MTFKLPILKTYLSSSIIAKNSKVVDWTLIANDDRKQEASFIILPIVIHYMFKKFFNPYNQVDEIKSAEEKFAESLQLAQMGMYHLLENDVSTKNHF